MKKLVKIKFYIFSRNVKNDSIDRIGELQHQFNVVYATTTNNVKLYVALQKKAKKLELICNGPSATDKNIKDLKKILEKESEILKSFTPDEIKVFNDINSIKKLLKNARRNPNTFNAQDRIALSIEGEQKLIWMDAVDLNVSYKDAGRNIPVYISTDKNGKIIKIVRC